MKKLMAVILAIVMLAAMGVTVYAANRPDVNPRIYEDENGKIWLESADDFYEWFGIDNQIALYKEALKEFVLEDPELFAALKSEYGVNNIDALIAAMWADGGLEVFCEGLSEDLDMTVTPANYRSTEVLRRIYILGIEAITDGQANIPDNATYEQVVEYVEWLFTPVEETTVTTTAAPETTTVVDETTTAAPETTTVVDETTTAAPETTTVVDETTTAAPETTTTKPAETTTKKAGESASPDTGDPSLALTGAFALMGALGVVATGKRKK